MNLKEQKEDYLKKELEQLQISKMIWEKERKSFDSIDLITYAARMKNNDDMVVLIEKFTEWVDVTKNDTEKNKIYIDLLKAIYRVYSYCFNLETVVNQSSVMLQTSENIRKNTINANYKEKLLLNQKIKQLEQQLENAKKEIDFINSGHK